MNINMDDLNNIIFRIKNIQKQISFYEENHLYFFKGKQFTSVTTFIGRHKQSFDASGSIIKKCAERNNITVNEMQCRWDDIKNEACNRGTLLHLYLENQIRGIDTLLPIECLKYSDGVSKFIEWINNKEWKLIDTEVMLYDEDECLAGQIDLLMYDPITKGIVVLDYKTNKNITMDNKYNQFMKNPYNNYADNNYNHYSLQLNIYGNMLEGFKFNVNKSKFLIHFIDDGFNVIECKNIKWRKEK